MADVTEESKTQNDGNVNQDELIIQQQRQIEKEVFLSSLYIIIIIIAIG